MNLFVQKIQSKKVNVGQLVRALFAFNAEERNDIQTGQAFMSKLRIKKLRIL
jgi:hypothetical protein